MQLVREGADPLYQQIAARLRYEIVTGQRAGGDRLPSLRGAAEDWGVNLHTVRRAYQELARAGLVRIGNAGARVTQLGPSGNHEGDDLSALVKEFAIQVQERFAVAPSDLARMFEGLGLERSSSRYSCSLIECSTALSRGLAEEVSSHYDVQVDPKDISDDNALEDGPIVGTYSHAEELRARLAGHNAELHLVRIRPRRTLLAGLSAEVAAGRLRNVIVVDRLPGSAHDLATDFQSHLGPSVSIEIRILSDPLLTFPQSASGTRVVASPQTWDRLTPELRLRPDVLELRYEIEPNDLERLARSLDWAVRPSAREH